MKEGKYKKTLAKIQVGAIFTCEISREMLVCLTYRASETPCLCPSEWHQHGGRYICYPVLLRTREFITRGTLVSPKRLEIEEYSISKQRALLRWKLLKMQVQFLVSVTRYESKNSGGSINLYFRYLVKLTSCEMFEVSFWKVLPSHGSLIENKKKKKDNIYINTITFFRLSCLTSVGK